jgi:hypothetical protein
MAKVNKTEQQLQDQRDAKKFLLWTAAITLGLVVLIYLLYSSAVG